MRICIASIIDIGELTWLQVEPYFSLQPQQIALNLHRLSHDTRNGLLARYSGHAILFQDYDPTKSIAIDAALRQSSPNYSIVVCPPAVTGLNEEALRLITHDQYGNVLPLRIGCPNDAIRHLDAIKDYTALHGISIINTPHIHAEAVAEYTFGQMIFHARRLDFFYAETGLDNSWPHLEAIRTTSGVRGRTLGVIGGGGKDGAAVIGLGIKCGMKVLGLSRSSEGRAKIESLGATVADSLEELVEISQFISVNCRSAGNAGLLGKHHIARMIRGVIIVNPAGADIIDKHALIADMSQKDGRIGKLILDMPYGGKRDATAFSADSDNAILKRLGVLFTPRMAGYTVDTCIRGTADLADRLRNECVGSTQPPTVQFDDKDLSSSSNSKNQLLADIIQLVVSSAENSLRLRTAGLAIAYKADSSPTTIADLQAEQLIRDGLRERGHQFVFIGEETQELMRDGCDREIVVDAIDGTRNFIDGNYGWCVSVAVRDHGDVVMGVVYDVCCRTVYSATKGGGAFSCTDGVSTRFQVPHALHGDFSFSVGSFRVRDSTVAKNRIIHDIKQLGGRERAWGSVALSICGVARGGLGAFIQGNSHLHDHIAARLIAEEAGVVFTTYAVMLDVDDIIVAHPSIADDIHRIFSIRTSSLPRETQ